jgi:hypothetical protein
LIYGLIHPAWGVIGIWRGIPSIRIPAIEMHCWAWSPDLVDMRMAEDLNSKGEGQKANVHREKSMHELKADIWL